MIVYIRPICFDMSNLNLETLSRKKIPYMNGCYCRRLSSGVENPTDVMKKKKCSQQQQCLHLKYIF